jgi:hypothetical protein
MNYLTRFFYLAVFLFILSKCAYHPSEELFKEVNQDPGFFSLSLNGNDTLLLFGEATIDLVYNTDDRPVHETHIYISDELIQEASYGISMFEFDTKSFRDGYHVLKISYKVKSNTGSLADQLDGEYVQFDFEKIVLIDNSPIDPVRILGFEMKDGLLNMIWSSFKGFGFEYYRADMTYSTNSQDTTALFINYAGGILRGNLDVSARGKQERIEYEYKDDLGINLMGDEFGNFRCTWQRSPYYDAFYKYSVVLKRNGYALINKDYSDINFDQVDFVHNTFPTQHHLSVKVNGNGLIDTLIGPRYIEFEKQLSSASRIVKKDSLIVIKGRNSLDAQFVQVYNQETDEFLATYEGRVDLSEDGNLILHFYEGKLDLIQVVNGIINKTFDLAFPDLNGDIKAVIFFDDKTFIIADCCNLHFINIESGQLEKSIETYLYFGEYDFHIPSHGQYMYSNYQGKVDLNTGTRTSLSESLLNPSNDRILAIKEGELMSNNFDGNEEKVINIAENLSFISSNSMEYFCGIEEGNEGKTVHIYSFKDYRKIQSINIDPFMTTVNYRFLMSDDYLNYLNYRSLVYQGVYLKPIE